MANTFDMPVLVNMVEGGRYRLYRGCDSLQEPLCEPTSLPSLFQITGPLQAYFHLAPPKTDLSHEEVLFWLDGACKMGCKVREVKSLKPQLNDYECGTTRVKLTLVVIRETGEVLCEGETWKTREQSI